MALAASPSPLTLADWLKASELPPPPFKRLVDKLVMQRWVRFSVEGYQTAPREERLLIDTDARPYAPLEVGR